MSGYLITDILIQEYDQTKQIRILAFWQRRIKRLYPALIVMLMATSTMIISYLPALLYNLRAILLTNVTYVYNLWATVNGDSYFDQWGGASPFTHLWSLSIEGQFYLIWPFIVLFLLKTNWRRTRVSLGIIGASLVSAGLLAFFYSPDNINRAYYGSDTRVFAILIGTSLAFVWPSNQLRPKVRETVKKRMNLIGWGTMGMLLIALVWLNGQWSITYYGGMYIVTVLMGVLVAITAHPASQFSQLLNNRYLNYLGTRSYSIYLYQLPVFVAFERLFKHHPNGLVSLIEIAVVLLLSELSYRFVEQGLRRYRQQNFMLTRASRVYAVLSLFLMMGTVTAIHTAASAKDKPMSALEKRLKQNKQKMLAANRAARQAQKKHGQTSGAHQSTQNNAIAQRFEITDQALSQLNDLNFTAVGDSLLLNAAPNLQQVLPKMVVNAEVGRQTQSVIDLLIGMGHDKTLADNVLIAVGTNGVVKPDMINAVMTAVGPNRQIYWVNAYADRPWVATNDANLADAAKRYRNLHIIDWHTAVSGHTDWLGPDAVHPNPDGSLAYTKLILQMILKYHPS
ncbi:acyltransferase family protein [Weissella diestrammenae]|uniref:acyltransferase family protein n=1 Tax=Weissella diestrammenae TaxID=1162633 RepID=UPI001FAD412C|nr:acyltransferase family protein [Weissella diestrammenae]